VNAGAGVEAGEAGSKVADVVEAHVGADAGA
jgi:hypothetical protein